MHNKFSLRAAWLLTVILCGGLFATAYWNLHLGIAPL